MLLGFFQGKSFAFYFHSDVFVEHFVCHAQRYSELWGHLSEQDKNP